MSSSFEFGKQLDSLADAISFGAAPAAIVLSANFGMLSLVFAICYVCSGLVRLAAFNLQKEKGVYFGLPIPAAALFVVAVFYFSRDLAPYALLISMVLMVLKIKIHKPKF
ncbi:MAG: CDP-alcohol phosphatidyltransferase family protein [Candidatus Micrarchaeota archaeon]